jgi:hypothetical protein
MSLKDCRISNIDAGEIVQEFQDPRRTHGSARHRTAPAPHGTRTAPLSIGTPHVALRTSHGESP